ncbi:MAG: hypothetical protein U1E36_05565 [Rickettsiales bacterium]
MDEEELKMILARDIPAPSKNFAERIILAAHSTPQRRPLSVWNYIREAFAECLVPKPAFVLASMLALGLVFGFNAANMQSPAKTSVQYVQDAWSNQGWGI